MGKWPPDPICQATSSIKRGLATAARAYRARQPHTFHRPATGDAEQTEQLHTNVGRLLEKLASGSQTEYATPKPVNRTGSASPWAEVLP